MLLVDYFEISDDLVIKLLDHKGDFYLDYFPGEVDQVSRVHIRVVPLHHLQQYLLELAVHLLDERPQVVVLYQHLIIYL